MTLIDKPKIAPIIVHLAGVPAIGEEINVSIGKGGHKWYRVACRFWTVAGVKPNLVGIPTLELRETDDPVNRRVFENMIREFYGANPTAKKAKCK